AERQMWHRVQRVSTTAPERALFLFRFLMPKEMGMEQEKWLFKSSTLQADLHRKLDPRKFYWITPTMSGIVGYVLGVPFGIPVIEELVVVYDGRVVVRPKGSAKTTMLGRYDDLVREWKHLLANAGLTPLERMEADCLFARKVGYVFEEAQ